MKSCSHSYYNYGARKYRFDATWDAREGPTHHKPQDVARAFFLGQSCPPIGKNLPPCAGSVAWAKGTVFFHLVGYSCECSLQGWSIASGSWRLTSLFTWVCTLLHAHYWIDCAAGEERSSQAVIDQHRNLLQRIQGARSGYS